MKYVVAIKPALEKMVRAANQNSREEVNQFRDSNWINVDKLPFLQLVPGVAEEENRCSGWVSPWPTLRQQRLALLLHLSVGVQPVLLKQGNNF